MTTTNNNDHLQVLSHFFFFFCLCFTSKITYVPSLEVEDVLSVFRDASTCTNMQVSIEKLKYRTETSKRQRVGAKKSSNNKLELLKT